MAKAMVKHFLLKAVLSRAVCKAKVNAKASGWSIALVLNFMFLASTIVMPVSS